MKSQSPSTKLQTKLKFQYSMTKTENRFGISDTPILQNRSVVMTA